MHFARTLADRFPSIAVSLSFNNARVAKGEIINPLKSERKISGRVSHNYRGPKQRVENKQVDRVLIAAENCRYLKSLVDIGGRSSR